MSAYSTRHVEGHDPTAYSLKHMIIDEPHNLQMDVLYPMRAEMQARSEKGTMKFIDG